MKSLQNVAIFCRWHFLKVQSILKERGHTAATGGRKTGGGRGLSALRHQPSKRAQTCLKRSLLSVRGCRYRGGENFSWGDFHRENFTVKKSGEISPQRTLVGM